MTRRPSETSPWSATAAPAKRSSSALLFDAGAVNRFGRVDDGTTVTDYDEEAIARKHTLACSIAYLEWNKTQDQFIDTPGMANFLSDARAGAARRGCRAGRRRRGRRRRGLDREGLGRRRRTRAAADRRAEPSRPRTREPRPLARVAARGVRTDGRAMQLPIGEEKSFTASSIWCDEGVDVCRPTERQADGNRDPRGPRGGRRRRRAKR